MSTFFSTAKELTASDFWTYAQAYRKHVLDSPKSIAKNGAHRYVIANSRKWSVNLKYFQMTELLVLAKFYHLNFYFFFCFAIRTVKDHIWDTAPNFGQIG